MRSSCEFSEFTNIFLVRTIKISLEAFYDASDTQPLITEDMLIELMKRASTSV